MINSLDTFNTIVAIWEIFAVIVLIYGFVKYATRRKSVFDITKFSIVERNRIIEASTKALKVNKVLLWLSPVFLFFVPVALYYYAGVDLLIAIVFGFLLVALSVQLHLYIRRFLKPFSVNEQIQNNQTR